MFVSSYICHSISFSGISFPACHHWSAPGLPFSVLPSHLIPLPLLVFPLAPCCKCYLYIVTPQLLSLAHTSLLNSTLEPPTASSSPVLLSSQCPPTCPCSHQTSICGGLHLIGLPSPQTLVSYLTPTIVSHRWLTCYKISQSTFWPVLTIFTVTEVQWSSLS